MALEQTSPDQRYAAFRHKAFLSYWAARFLTTFATMIVSVAVGWQIYDLTRDPFDLGIVGIVQFLPSLLLVLVTGVVADRFGRRLIMTLSTLVETACALALLLLTVRGLGGPLPIFAVLAMFGIARAFYGPASSSLFANLVPQEDFANAIAWNSSADRVVAVPAVASKVATISVAGSSDTSHMSYMVWPRRPRRKVRPAVMPVPAKEFRQPYGSVIRCGRCSAWPCARPKG